MKRAKVTFFMIAYNEEKLISKAIQSVLDQTEPNIELYVRNNGSTDRTGDIVRKIARRDSRIHLVENTVNWRKDPEGKVPFVNKKGAIDIWPIDKGTLGEYVAFLDADDRLHPAFVKELLQVAQTSGAEIVACGNVFMLDGTKPVGERLPPSVQFQNAGQWGPSLRDFNTFVQLYNVFRTYWGKLFQRDFFLRYYDEAWFPVGGEFGAFVDTAVMLRYLRRCERLSFVRSPLYLFTQGSGSTYANFPSQWSILKALQAEALFDEGLRFLQKKNALTQSNHQFLYQLNWAFCYEAIAGLQYVKESTSYDLDRVIILLNNKVASSYLSGSSGIWPQLEPILQNVWIKGGQRMEMYLRYPIRLMYLKRLMEAHPGSELLPTLLLGILCDPENRNLLGRNLLPEIAQSFPGLQQTVRYIVHMEWTLRQNSHRNIWAERIQNEDGLEEELVERLRQAFDSERYEDASELLSRLSGKSPLHRDGLYYRIQLAELIGEHELAVVLAASARILFGVDIEMQNLCWFILGQI